MPTLQETHFGLVTDNNDPEKRGRLKVKSQSLTGADYELPDWIEPSGNLYASKSNGATLFVPAIGSTVELVADVHDTDFDDMPNERFLDNPAMKWRAATLSTQDGPMPLPADLLTNYPERRGIVTPAGHTLIFDDSSGELIIKSKAGSTMVFKANGDIVLKSPVKIGDGATELMILGNAFMTLYNAHTHPTGVGPSGPPSVAMTAAQLSQEGNAVK
jgi:hypothetical protein